MQYHATDQLQIKCQVEQLQHQHLQQQCVQQVEVLRNKQEDRTSATGYCTSVMQTKVAVEQQKAPVNIYTVQICNKNGTATTTKYKANCTKTQMQAQTRNDLSISKKAQSCAVEPKE